MDEASDVKILVLARRENTRRRWTELMRKKGAEVPRAPDEMPPDWQPEVILIERETAGETRPDRLPTEAAGTDAGVIRVGHAGAADVHLPQDATERELWLACRLLGRIVRLRRRERSGAQLRRRLSLQALSDPLTELPNRRAWEQELKGRLASANNSRRLCLAVLDLDLFKRINDVHGHAHGDEVLRRAGEAICGGLREDDFVARLGGDEFALLLWVADANTAAVVVERVRASLPGRLARAATHAVTASAGYRVVPAGELPRALPSAEELYGFADAAMHRAKRQGRDRTVGT